MFLVGHASRYQYYGAIPGRCWYGRSDQHLTIRVTSSISTKRKASLHPLSGLSINKKLRGIVKLQPT
jgi:hypothetical protein